LLVVPLPVSDTRIDLWLAECAAPDDRLLDRYRELLPVHERGAEWRLRRPADRRRYLVTKALVRTVLSRYSPTRPPDWRFGTNAYGRPHVANDDAIERAICFNVSHTTEVVLVGVTGLRGLGVDIEAVRDGDFAVAIAERFFAATEVAAFRAQAPERRRDLFFQLWTLKEAYIKARGMGLSIPLESFAFDLQAPASIRFSSPPAHDEQRWRFWQMQPVPDHVAAVCAEQRPGPPPTVSMRRVVPLVGDEPLSCPVLRQSG
jgi:4'-phosphopantetheinyl transferase